MARINVSIHAPAWGATRFPFPAFDKAKSFNPRTRVGCDQRDRETLRRLIQFQSTHPRGVRLYVVLSGCSVTKFQSTHPRGVRRLLRRHRPHRCREFQSTHPRGVRRHTCDAARAVMMFQSTHPRGVRPLLQDSPHSGLLVSIHAPAWGATRGERPMRAPRSVSIHAPAWGATTCSTARTWSGCAFQSTHPRGVRQDQPYTPMRPIVVSIHAPAWGATDGSIRLPFSHGSFNPRTRVGCDTPASQPRLRWTGFNPRTRVGCDDDHERRLTRLEAVSIHAPAWGATVSMFYPVDSRD